jgi:di/tricarboxylate transporter
MLLHGLAGALPVFACASVISVMNVPRDVAVQIGGRFAGVSNVTTAMMGISVLMMLGIITWKDVLAYGPAWDTLFWFAILIGMATNLDKLGVIKVFADQLAEKIDSIGLGMLPVSLPVSVFERISCLSIDVLPDCVLCIHVCVYVCTHVWQFCV